MASPRAVHRNNGPLIVQGRGDLRAEGSHRLDAQHHALNDLRATSGPPPVGNIRIHVHLGTDPVAGVLTNDAVVTVMGFQGCLHRCGNVADPGSRHDLGDTGPHRLTGHLG